MSYSIYWLIALEVLGLDSAVQLNLAQLQHAQRAFQVDTFELRKVSI